MKPYALYTRFGNIILYFLILLLAFVMIYPLFWMISASFKSNLEIFTSIGLIPKEPVWTAYADGWKPTAHITFTTFFLNTFMLVVPTVIFTLISSYIVAYGFARYKFRGWKLFFSLMIGCLLLPKEVLIVPRYLLFNRFGWLNTYLPFIVPAAFATYSFFIFLLIQYIRGIPLELDQSAKIDGANAVNIMVRILLPLCKPALFSVTIFQFVWRWNDFFDPLIYINSVKKYPVALGLRMCIELSGEAVAWNRTLAMAVLTMLPPTILYMVSQKTFVEGITTTGIKG
jgi:oligogalacturonide transport system permease protein